MPTLSKFPLIRLSPLRRMPFWAQALAACALFAAVGVGVLDDYGLGVDEASSRGIVRANADYILGLYEYDVGASSKPSYLHIIYYGLVIEMPLLLAERALGLQDSRDIYLMRHLLTHLFFIAGGFACGMLAYRMFGSRWIALLAMSLFLLHPRLYAHSFFNSKDVPFAALMVIALYLTNRAFRKDTIGAFLICGIGVGLAINLRVFGLMLLPMILAMRGMDLWQAGKGERKHILATAGIFAATTLATLYITHPYYWENPLRFVEGIRVLSQHPVIAGNLFMGELYRSDAVPWNFLPVWFLITAPPVALALGALGAAAVCWQAITRPLAALRDREIRFGVLLLGCFVMPVVVVIALQSSIYNGWRHMYFLWGPFCLLAVVGLHTITNIRMGGGIWKRLARLPGGVRGDARLRMGRRALAYGIAGAGLITTATAMAALHPNQQVYFNGLVDTKTPGALGERYDMDYWMMTHRQLLEYLLARYPDDTLRVLRVWRSEPILPLEDRERIISLTSPHAADFYLFVEARHNKQIRKSLGGSEFYFHPRINVLSMLDQPPLYAINAYGNAIAYIIAPNKVAAYRAAYEDIEANGTLLTRSAFDVYLYDDALYYLGEDCAPLSSNGSRMRFFLHIVPDDPANLPSHRREHGFENLDFRLDAHTDIFFEGKCIHRQVLPDYAIGRIRTGQNAAELGGDGWSADIDLAGRAAARAVYESIAAGDYGKPVAQSGFDVYMRDGALAYLKEDCAAGDEDARFFLHIVPVDPADLPAVWRERGFENLDFGFAEYGAYVGDDCVAARELPGYGIERVRTGQFVGGEGVVWSAEFDPAAHAVAQAVYESIAAGEYGQPMAQADFDVYLRGNSLAYLKESCAEGDTYARFLLHIIPADPADLPAIWRERGFENLDFQFADHGARIDGKCVAERELPDYAIERIRTGQFVSGEGQLWGAEFAVGR